MQAVVGGAEIRGGQLAITEYRPWEGALTAVAAWQGRFHADDYPLLKYQVDTVPPSQALKLFWRLSNNPQGFYTIDLHVPDHGSSWLNLAQYPIWQGEVENIGVFATSNTAEQELSISHLTLEPGSWRPLLASYWFDWTSFRGWSIQSINYLQGAAGQQAPSPVPVAAAWSALAVGLLLIAGRLAGGSQPGALAAVLLLPWLALDLLWQRELLTQLAHTREQFAGKTVHEKHLVDVDRRIYSYTKRLQDEVLPTASSRIVILHDSRGHDFGRLKVQYYLLPHNIYNFGRTPPGIGVDDMDYILVLGEIADLEFHPDTNTLVWSDGERTLAVELLDSDPFGKLYRVLHSNSGMEEL